MDPTKKRPLGGFEGGYQVYMSARSENDLDDLRKITGDPTILAERASLSASAQIGECRVARPAKIGPNL